MDLDATEIKFAKQLAANEKKTRDKSLKKLRKYLQVKSKKNGFSHEDFLRIWKGLHYCMWMQDKPLIQEELSTKISQLVHDVTNNELKWLFIKVFIETEVREWEGIDVWRVDKFMMLFRNMLTEALTILKNQNWKSKSVEGLLGVYTETMWNITADIPGGLRTHFMDIYLPELNKVAGDKLSAKQFVQFIEPCIKLMKDEKDPDGEVSHKVIKAVFDPIIERTTMLQMSKEEKKRNGVQFSRLQIDSKLLADYLFDLGKSDSITSKKRSMFYKLVQRLQDASDGVQPSGPKHAGHVALPKKMVGEAVSSLLKMETEFKTRPTKQQLKALKKQKGKENSHSNIIDISMSALDEGLTVSRKRKHAAADDDDCSNETLTKAKRAAMDKEENAVSMDNEDDQDESAKEDIEEKIPILKSGKKKLKKKEKLKVQEKKSANKKKIVKQNQVDSGSKDSVSKDSAITIEMANTKTLVNGTPQTGKGKDKTAGKTTKTQAKSKPEKKVQEAKKTDETKESDGKITGSTGKGTTKQTGNTKGAKKRKISVVPFNDTNNCDKCQVNKQSDSEQLTNTDQVDAADATAKPTVNGCSVIQIKSSDDLEEGEVEIFVPSKKYKGMVSVSEAGKFAEFENKKTPIAFVKRALAKTNKSMTPTYLKRKMGTPMSNTAFTRSAKKVSFNMRKNQSQSFKDSLKSPIVPFNPTKTPDSSILKAKTGKTPRSGSVLRSGRKASAETPPSTGSLKTLKTPKRALIHKAVSIKAPVMNLQAKFKRKSASDFFAL